MTRMRAIGAMGGVAGMMLGWLAIAGGGCGGNGASYKKLCSDVCDKIAACGLGGGGDVPPGEGGGASSCQQSCLAETERHCANDSARASVAQSCLAMGCEGLRA